MKLPFYSALFKSFSKVVDIKTGHIVLDAVGMGFYFSAISKHTIFLSSRTYNRLFTTVGVV